MSQLGFNHVFAGLMGLSLISAFAVPPRYTDPLRASIQGLFYPVAAPARQAGGWLRQRVAGPETDGRSPGDILEENRRLRSEVTHLHGEVGTLQRTLQDRERIGPIADLCTPVAVMGADPARRDSLSLQGSFPAQWEGLAVLYAGGMVGRIDRAGSGGAQVRLVTDRGFGAAARFGRFDSLAPAGQRFAYIETKAAFLEGCGDGRMVVRNLQVRDVEAAQLRAGDVAVLDDHEWPILRGQLLGTIEKIEPRPESPLSADIYLRPQRTLTTLAEVMVVTRQ
jgi:cell shape-determining protein MreC